MRRSTWIPLLSVVIALAVLAWIFLAARPETVAVGGEDAAAATSGAPGDVVEGAEPEGD